MKKAKSKKTARTPAAKRKSVPPLVVADYDWGSVYTGTKESFIRSGLVTEKDFPKSTSPRVLDNYRSYFDHGDRIRSVEWSHEDGTGWRAWVRYETHEIAPEKIIKLAQKAVTNAMAQLQYDIGQLKPAPLSQTLNQECGIKARAKEEKIHG